MSVSKLRKITYNSGSKHILSENSTIPVALVAPLDWGLGHTTRCIPIIQQLQQHGYQVLVAGEGAQEHILTHEFPDITCLHLPGYRIQYSHHKRWLAFKIIQQLPKILRSIQNEHKWLKKQIQQHNIQLVVSDNRYGIRNKKVKNVFVTHQLTIQTPFSWLTRLVQKINYTYLNRYNICWVPDMADSQFNIAGALSHPHKLPRIPVHYIGPLSRFQSAAAQPAHTGSFVYKWLFLLSGPEPQRSILEEKLLAVASKLPGPVFLLRAKPGATSLPAVPANCTVVNHLPTDQMQHLIQQCEFVLSRSGYTTVMEMLALQKKTLLIPTPGQTEQEYLAQRLHNQHWCYCCLQEEDLLVHIRQAEAFSYLLPLIQSHQLADAIKAL